MKVHRPRAVLLLYGLSKYNTTDDQQRRYEGLEPCRCFRRDHQKKGVDDFSQFLCSQIYYFIL